MACTQKQLDAARRYRERHPERIKASQKRYRSTDEYKAKRAEDRKQPVLVAKELAYREQPEVKEKRKLAEIKYRMSEHGKLARAHREHLRRQHCKDTDITLEWLTGLKEKTAICPYCGEWITDDMILHIEHIKPLSIGGKHVMDNVVFTCATCNLVKHTQDYSDWRV